MISGFLPRVGSLALAVLLVLALVTQVSVAQEAVTATKPAADHTAAKADHGASKHVSEADLVLPDLGKATFFGLNGYFLLYGGLLVCFGGLFFGMKIYQELKQLPVHASMLEVSELIYETCKTYLINQGKFLAILWAIIAEIGRAHV